MPADTNTPYRRIGSNSWKELLDQVNDKLENPPDDTDCEPLEPIEEPEEDHKWAKSDIEEVHNRLDEMPGNCFVWEPIPDKWKKSIIDNIEEQLENAWCDCEEECLQQCSNAQDSHTEEYLGTWTITACHACGECGSPTTCDKWSPEFSGYVDQAKDELIQLFDKLWNWELAHLEYCSLKEEVEELEDELEHLEDELEALQQYADEVCAIPDNEAACQAANDAVDEKQQEVDEKQEEVDEKTEERDEKQSEADGYLSEVDGHAQANMNLIQQACSYDGCGTCLAGSAGSEPCVDWDCESLGPECMGRYHRRCCVAWNIQTKTTTYLYSGWSREGSWSTRLGGRYTPNGLPYASNIGFPCIPAYACWSCGPGGGCNYGCSAYQVTEARKITAYPYTYPGGEICCGGGGEGGE